MNVIGWSHFSLTFSTTGFKPSTGLIDWCDPEPWSHEARAPICNSFFFSALLTKKLDFCSRLSHKDPLPPCRIWKKRDGSGEKISFFSQWILSLSCCAYPNHLGNPPSPHSSAPLPPSREPWDWWNMGLCGRSDFTKSRSLRRQKLSHRADLSN